MNLSVTNIFRTVVVNDMKDHRNNEQVRSAGVIVLVGKDFALKRLERDFKLRVGRAAFELRLYAGRKEPAHWQIEK